MRIVLIGAPGSGKGTVSEFLRKDFHLPHLSVGALLREKAKNDKELKKMLDNGELVDHTITKQVLNERISKPDCKNGFILDGHPRSFEQIADLEELGGVDYVIWLSVTDEQVFDRLQKRVFCPVCNRTYDKTIYNKDVCENCKQKLVVRADDTPQTIKKRIKVFNKEIQPIVDYYGDKVLKIICTNNQETTYKPIKDFFEKEVKKSGRKDS